MGPRTDGICRTQTRLSASRTTQRPSNTFFVHGRVNYAKREKSPQVRFCRSHGLVHPSKAREANFGLVGSNVRRSCCNSIRTRDGTGASPPPRICTSEQEAPCTVDRSLLFVCCAWRPGSVACFPSAPTPSFSYASERLQLRCCGFAPGLSGSGVSPRKADWQGVRSRGTAP